MNVDTLVGMPAPSDDTHEPFPLCTLKNTGIRRRADLPRALREKTELRPRMRERTPQRATAARGNLKEFALSAAIVFVIGAALLGWLL